MFSINYLLRSSVLSIMLVVIAVALPVSAQSSAPDDHPLLQMLALVPDTPEAREWLNYADYRAMEAARGIETPTAADFENRTDLADIWIAASTGLSTGMELNYFQNYLTDMPRLVGFSFFDIDQSMTFGQPPAMGTILKGNFDPAQIAEAYSAREFTSTQVADATLWCGPDGCESGFNIDLAGREVGNPFGGEIGRKEPLAVLPNGFVADSPHFPIVEAVLDVSQDSSNSLVAVPDYRAVAEALIANGSLVQAQFINPLDIAFADLVLPEQMASIEEVVAGYGELPVYSLAVLADTWEGDEQTAWIGLVYNSAETAQQAADELTTRINTSISLVTDRPFTDALATFDAEIQQPVIYETEDRAVMLLPIVYPIPPNEQIEGDSGLRSSSLVFRMLMSELLSRGLYFLAVDLPS